MDVDSLRNAVATALPPPQPPPLIAPPSSSAISDPPLTDTAPSDGPAVPSESATKSDSPEHSTHQPRPGEAPQLSAQTEEILQRIKANGSGTGSTPGFEATKEQMMRDMATSDKFPTPTPPSLTKRGGRGNRGSRGGKAGKRVSLTTDGVDGSEVAVTTPTTRGRGRGSRPPGRPRGSRGRSSTRGGGRGGKRKREDEDEDGDDSDTSEVYTSAATQTKSGRSVQKPTTFVPPPPASPVTTHKRKRTYRRNPESAVCKVCLRGTSPLNNMIVFCDGCNTPYHRYCHHPPIDQAVIDEVDKEWHCKPCETERTVPVPETDVSSFISAEGVPVDERKRYFSCLTPGLLVTLLTKATTLRPDLPVFAPTFKPQVAASEDSILVDRHSSAGTSLPATAAAVSQASHVTAGASSSNADDDAHFIDDDEEDYGPDEHPANYPRPGQGLMRTLPPEQEDLQWLVDDEDKFGVFSHVYQVDPQAANAGMGVGGGGDTMA